MKYLILIYHNQKSREVWEGFTEAQRAEGIRAHNALVADLVDSGRMVAAEALADPSQAKRVSVRDGKTSTTDGPFAEVKEYLAGFYLIDCASLDEAVAQAARIPEAAAGQVEVRPVLASA